MEKILVIGPALGQLTQLFAKVDAINSKNGPFDLCLCIGDLFQDVHDESIDQLLNGEIKISVPTYFVFGGRPLPKKIVNRVETSHGEITQNLIFLGKQGIYTLSSGCRIATFGGRFDLDQFTGAETNDTAQSLTSPYFTASAVASFKTQLQPALPEEVESFKAAKTPAQQPVDILITHEWPTQITHLSQKPIKLETAANAGVSAISEILACATPRYHFVSSQTIFYEREPFTWPTSATSITRFISLAPFLNTTKERWFYAFNIAPIKIGDPAFAKPANVTACPLDAGHAQTRGTKRAFGMDDTNEQVDYRFGGATKNGRQGKKEKGAPPPDYICRLCNQSGHWIQDCTMATTKTQRAPLKEISPSECWFCLSNPKVAKHLIASIGNEAYLALPKGQLPSIAGGSPVPGGGHVLIIPIGHYPTLLSLPPEQAISLVSEIEQYKSALRQCYAKYNASFVSFEVGRLSGRGGHAHVQICPIPQNKADQVEAAFKQQGLKDGCVFEEDGDDVLQRQSIHENYFRVDLPDGRRMLHLIKPGKPFNLQFGRSVLAQLLDMPERADWKFCAGTDAEEKAECQAFKKAFKPFDRS